MSKKEKPKAKPVTMAKYQCSVCGYIYDPAVGDEPNVKAGTPWEKIPDDWVCPVCGADKDMFEKM